MRLFIATLLSDANQAAYARLIEKLIAAHPDWLRPIPDDSAHITHAFSGHVDESSLGSVIDVVRHVTTDLDPIEVELAPPRVLSVGRDARLVCADITTGGDDVRALTDRIVGMLRGRSDDDWNPSRSPHVTVARFRRGVRRRDAEAVTESVARLGSWPSADVVARVLLVESKLTRDGASYGVLPPT